jgi:hypothetical protein
MSLGAGDLMAALAELHDRFGCERSTAAFRLADGELMTVSLDEHSNLEITRESDGTIVLYNPSGRHR